MHREEGIVENTKSDPPMEYQKGHTFFFTIPLASKEYSISSKWIQLAWSKFSFFFLRACILFYFISFRFILSTGFSLLSPKVWTHASWSMFMKIQIIRKFKCFHNNISSQIFTQKERKKKKKTSISVHNQKIFCLEIKIPIPRVLKKPMCL